MLNLVIMVACLIGGVWSCAATSGGGTVTTAPSVCSIGTAVDTTVPTGLEIEGHSVMFSNEMTSADGVTTIVMTCTPVTNPTTSMTVNGDITLQNPSTNESYTLSCGGPNSNTNSWTLTPPTGPPLVVTSAFCQG